MGKFTKVLVLLAMGAVLAGVVGWFVFDKPLDYWLDCNRFSGNCTFTQKLALWSRVASAPIPALRKAQVRVKVSPEGKPRYYVWVVSDQGDKFFARYRERAEAEADSERINAFLRDPTSGRLVLTRSDRKMYWVAWGLVPVAAAFVVALASVLFSKKGRPAAGRDS